MKKLENFIQKVLNKSEAFLETVHGYRFLKSMIIIGGIYLILGSLCKDGEIVAVNIVTLITALCFTSVHYSAYTYERAEKEKENRK